MSIDFKLRAFASECFILRNNSFDKTFVCAKNLLFAFPLSFVFVIYQSNSFFKTKLDSDNGFPLKSDSPNIISVRFI